MILSLNVLFQLRCVVYWATDNSLGMTGWRLSCLGNGRGAAGARQASPNLEVSPVYVKRYLTVKVATVLVCHELTHLTHQLYFTQFFNPDQCFSITKLDLKYALESYRLTGACHFETNKKLPH